MMIGKEFCGTNECYVCGKLLNWGKPASVRIGMTSVYKVPEVKAEICAVDKNEDGSVKFEVECICSRCQTKNKFYIDEKV